MFTAAGNRRIKRTKTADQIVGALAAAAHALRTRSLADVEPAVALHEVRTATWALAQALATY
jgi:hypothetical protein